MKNKKTIITMIVIFVTAVFVVVGAYAYFASSVDTNGTSYLNTTLPAGSYNFTVTEAGELNMTFTSDQMMASGVSTSPIVNGNTDIEVQLLSSDNDSEVTCTYDLVWEWTSLDKYTTSDATLPLVENAITYNYEYSVEATSETTGSPSGTNYGSSNTLNEKDLSKYTWSGNKATILSGAKITSKSSETPTITNWDIKANIYNIPVNQVNLLNKEFKATIKVDNVQCNFAGGSAPAGDANFATDDWATVIANLKSANNPYNVGDTRCIELDSSIPGTDGTNGCENGGYLIRLVNKSTPAECSTPGFSQSSCGNVIQFIEKDSSWEEKMKEATGGDGSTEGGWADTDLRKYLNPIDGTPDSGAFFNALPEIVRNAIIPTTVVSGHGCEDTENIVSTDKLYILSLHEVVEEVEGGEMLSSVDTAYNNTRQLDYYKNNNVMFNSLTEDESKLYVNFDKVLTKTYNVAVGDEEIEYRTMIYSEDWLRTPGPGDTCDNNQEYFYIEGMSIEGYGTEAFFVGGLAGRYRYYTPAFRI